MANRLPPGRYEPSWPDAPRSRKGLTPFPRRPVVWPFTHFNRTHVVPPLTITDEEMRDGLAILDEALLVADKYAVA